MSGIGRAWSRPPDLVAEAARCADCRCAYTNLRLDHDIDVGDKKRCPLRRVVLPLDAYGWRVAALLFAHAA